MCVTIIQKGKWRSRKGKKDEGQEKEKMHLFKKKKMEGRIRKVKKLKGKKRKKMGKKGIGKEGEKSMYIS